ncbi:MAG: hypothetical protein F4Z31_01610 [Gemmatimonadetes bacterium]|nr:hypothetical protein [Gemmatimonadota bacterium]
MLVIAIDGLAHSGKGDFGAAIQRLTANAIGYSVEEAGTLLAEAAYRAAPTARLAERMQMARLDPTIRRGVFDWIRAESEGLAGLVVKGPGVYADDAFPDADERCFVRTRPDRRLQRAEKVQAEDWYAIEWIPEALAAGCGDDTEAIRAKYLETRDVTEQQISVEAIENDEIPVAPGVRELRLPYTWASGPDTVTEDLLAVSWLAEIRSIFDRHNITTIDPDQLPDYSCFAPLSDPEAAERAAQALHEQIAELG